MKFTLIEVVTAVGILALSLAGLLQLLTASQERIAKSVEHWNNTHMLMQAAEYALLQKTEDNDMVIPEEIFDYQGFQPIITFEDVEDQLPEDFEGQMGQIPLVGVKIEIMRDRDKKTVSEVIVDRFSYEDNAL